MALGEHSGSVQYTASERVQIPSGCDGTPEGFYAGSFKCVFEEKKKIQKLFIRQIRWFSKTR